MKETAVLRVPRTDDDDGYVLVHVTTTGPKGLDFKLDATDGADPFALTCTYPVSLIDIPDPLSGIPSKWTFAPTAHGKAYVLCMLHDILYSSHGQTNSVSLNSKA